tara:strand:- start:1055 stop:1723 length:669 start_codon:yes stop_codon:yes gene_type:complete
MSLLEVSVATGLLTGLTLVLFGLLSVAQGQVAYSGRVVQTVSSGFRLRARTMSLLRTAPLRSTSSSDWPTSTPSGWIGVNSPSIVKGAGSAPDQLMFMVPVAADTDGNGILGSDEIGLGASGVVGDYYHVRVVTLNGIETLVRDLRSGVDGSVLRREHLANPVAPARTVGTPDVARAFLVSVPGTDPRALTFRLRVGHVTKSSNGATVVEHERSYDVTIGQD